MSLLEVKNLRTYFNSFHGVVKAVDGISFELNAKETLGIVGESGSGKSQTAMSILKLLAPNQEIAEGQILFDGHDITKYNDQQYSKIRGNEIAIIFQDAISCLNPVFTIEYQICELLQFHQKLSKKDAVNKAIELLESVKISNPKTVLKQYPHQLSGGMSQRVMIAIALACKPKILIADEPTTALDVIIQAEIIALMNELKEKYNTAIIFITHDLGVIYQIANYIIVMNNGRIVEKAPAKQLINRPAHPYTKQLLNAFLMTGVSQISKHMENVLSEPLSDLAPYTIEWAKTGIVDEQWYEVEPHHFIACTLK